MCDFIHTLISLFINSEQAEETHKSHIQFNESYIDKAMGAHGFISKYVIESHETTLVP